MGCDEEHELSVRRPLQLAGAKLSSSATSLGPPLTKEAIYLRLGALRPDGRIGLRCRTSQPRCAFPAGEGRLHSKVKISPHFRSKSMDGTSSKSTTSQRSSSFPTFAELSSLLIAWVSLRRSRVTTQTFFLPGEESRSRPGRTRSAD